MDALLLSQNCVRGIVYLYGPAVKQQRFHLSNYDLLWLHYCSGSVFNRYLIQDLAADSNHNAADRGLQCCTPCRFDHMAQQSVAAGYLHDHNPDRFDLRLIYQGRKFFYVYFLIRIQFWAGDGESPVFQEIFMKVCV